MGQDMSFEPKLREHIEIAYKCVKAYRLKEKRREYYSKWWNEHKHVINAKRRRKRYYRKNLPQSLVVGEF